MKITERTILPPVVTPPPTYILELTLQELAALRAISHWASTVQEIVFAKSVKHPSRNYGDASSIERTMYAFYDITNVYFE